MNIGIDIDGVLTDLDAYKKIRGKAFFKKEIVDPLGKDVDELFGVSREEKAQFWHDSFKDYITNPIVREGVSDATHQLHEAGYKIFIITARKIKEHKEIFTEKEYKRLTREFLDKNDIYYDELAFYPNPKIRAIKDKKIDIFIEDSVQNIEELSKHIKVIIFDSVYNRDIDLPNTKRVTSWSEIKDKIKDLQK